MVIGFSMTWKFIWYASISGQVNGWTALPSTYAVEARDENDVVNAVKFAKDNNLRLVVKGTGNKTDIKSNPELYKNK